MNDAPIKIGEGGQPVLFSDVGQVQDSHQIQSNIVRVNNRPLVYVPVYRQPGSNTIEIVDRIKGKMAEILGKLKDERKLDNGEDDPKMKNLTLDVVMDQSVKVRESIDALWIAGILGAVFSGLVVFVFLQNWRATLVITLAIPISIMVAMIGLYFTGNTINAMTLGGLALAVGILIDQAIVVIDNIERHIEAGEEPLQSAWAGTTEVAVPLLVSTITFIVVFFPVMFLSGLAKYLFSPLAMSVLFAVIASYLIAIFFIPVAASKLMGKKRDENNPTVPNKDALSGSYDPDKLNWLVGGYRRLLLGALKVRWLILLISFGLFIGSLFLMSTIGSELFPPVDAGQFTIYIRARSGTELKETERLIAKIENILVDELGDPAPNNPTADSIYPVTKVKYTSGENRILTDAERQQALADSSCSMLISNIGVLLDWPAAYSPNSGPMDAFTLVQLSDKRKGDVFEIVERLRARLNADDDLKKAGVDFAFDTGGILTAALNMGEPSPIHLQVTGYTLTTAQDIAQELVKTMESVEGAADVRIAQRNDYPMIKVDIDRVKALSLGVNVDDAMRSIVSATNSSINFDPAFWIDPKNGNHYFLGTQYFERDINSLETLKTIGIRNKVNNSLVDLQDIATFDATATGPAVINHRNITRVTDVFANVRHGYDMGSVVAEIEAKLQDNDHPLRLVPTTDSRSAAARYPMWFQNILTKVGLNSPTKYKTSQKGFSIDVQGEIRAMRNSFVDFAVGMVLATALVYLVMVAQFRSFLDPFIVLVTVPLGFIGVAVILKLTGTRLNIQSFMGIIMMIGIVVEYTIVLLDFANHRLEEGATIQEAIVDAAVVRFRPILMTSLTTILALTPMAFPSVFGGLSGGEADIPLARTIVGGVIAATLLPKFVVPCLYVMMKRPVKKTKPEPGWET